MKADIRLRTFSEMLRSLKNRWRSSFCWQLCSFADLSRVYDELIVPMNDVKTPIPTTMQQIPNDCSISFCGNTPLVIDAGVNRQRAQLKDVKYCSATDVLKDKD